MDPLSNSNVLIDFLYILEFTHTQKIRHLGDHNSITTTQKDSVLWFFRRRVVIVALDDLIWNSIVGIQYSLAEILTALNSALFVTFHALSP